MARLVADAADADEHTTAPLLVALRCRWFDFIETARLFMHAETSS